MIALLTLNLYVKSSNFPYLLMQGRSYIYAKTYLHTHLDKNMGRLYHNYDGFLMIYVYKMCA